MKPQPRAKKRKSLQKQHPQGCEDETHTATDVVSSQPGQGLATVTVTARQTDQNANVVERVQSDISNDSQETEGIGSNDRSSELVVEKEATVAQNQDSIGSAQRVKPKVRVKPQVPVKPKPALWKCVSPAESEKTTEDRTCEGGASETPRKTKSSQSDDDAKDSSVSCSAGPDLSEGSSVTQGDAAGSKLDASGDSSTTDGDTAVSTGPTQNPPDDTAVSSTRPSLRRSGSYEAAVVNDDSFYDDVVCPTQQATQRQDRSDVDDPTMTHSDTVTEGDSQLNDTDIYYSELAECGGGGGQTEAVDSTVGESDTEDGVCDDPGGVYSYADMPLAGSDAEAAEQPKETEQETKDQKKQSSGLGVSFRAFFRGKLGGGKKEKVRKTSNSSFYREAESGSAMDSSVPTTTASDSDDYDADHDYIYIDDLNESEVSGEDKTAVERTDGPPTMKPVAGEHRESEKRKEDPQPERPLPRVPPKRHATTVKPHQPTVPVRRTQSDSVPVLPPRRKRNASRKAMLDMNVAIQRRREPSQVEEDNEYIIPEYDAGTDSPQGEELPEDEGYLVPQQGEGDSVVPGSIGGEKRDSEDYVLPQDVGNPGSMGGYDDGDYLVPVSQDDNNKESSGDEDKNNDSDYLVPVSVTDEKKLFDTVSPCQLTVAPCHLSDSESDDDDYVRPESQDHSHDQSVDRNIHCLTDRHSSVSEEDVRDRLSSRVTSDVSTDVSSESGYYINDGRMSLSHNDLHRVVPSLLHPTVVSLKRRSFPGSDAYSNCSVPGDRYGGMYVPMDSGAEYADSRGSGSSFSESHSDTSDYEPVGVCESHVKVSLTDLTHDSWIVLVFKHHVMAYFYYYRPKIFKKKKN